MLGDQCSCQADGPFFALLVRRAKGSQQLAIVAAGAETWEVDTFLMSCRVLRRGVENAVVQCIADDAAEAGATLLAGGFGREGGLGG